MSTPKDKHYKFICDDPINDSTPSQEDIDRLYYCCYSKPISTCNASIVGGKIHNDDLNRISHTKGAIDWISKGKELLAELTLKADNDIAKVK